MPYIDSKNFLHSEMGTTYDLFGRAVYYLCQILSQLPLLPKAEQALLVRTGAAFMPTPSEITRPFQEEADAAKQRRPKLEKMAAELKAFPIGMGTTLYDIVAAFISAGVRIDTLLGQRADATAATLNPDAAAASRLRSTTIGLILRLRQAVDDEIASNPALYSKMSIELFTHMDQLSAMRIAQASKPASDSGSDSDGTENTPAPAST